jgi:hypothetical protein
VLKLITKNPIFLRARLEIRFLSPPTNDVQEAARSETRKEQSKNRVAFCATLPLAASYLFEVYNVRRLCVHCFWLLGGFHRVATRTNPLARICPLRFCIAERKFALQTLRQFSVIKTKKYQKTSKWFRQIEFNIFRI